MQDGYPKRPPAPRTRLAGLDAVVGGGGWVGHPHALGVDGHNHRLQGGEEVEAGCVGFVNCG